MIASFDSMEYIKLNFSSDAYNDDLSAVIQDFCFGLASFFTDFALKIDCDTEKAMELKDVCLSCIEENIDYILGQGILEPDVTIGVTQEELDDFSERMRAKGF